MNRKYCRKHGIEYIKEVCPECAKEIEQEAENRKRNKAERDKKRQERARKWDEMVERTIWLPEVSNPTLIGVKMFLADVIQKVNMPYDWDEHNCAHFAKEIQDAASQSRIKCGYVTITFKNSEIGHAIIAFETDYGLKFFEPQSAEEEDVIIGRRYSAKIIGVSDDAIISKVEIFWNDGEKTIIDN